MRAFASILVALALLNAAFGHFMRDVSSKEGEPALSPFPSCNTGPMHHGHVVLPLGVGSAEECKQRGTQFLLSHGATFFCPHTWDIKLLASLADDAAREALCTSYFHAVAAGQSPIHLFRPTLEQGGLPATALGQLRQWETPAIYHVHSFGSSNADGPDSGWNMTTIYEAAAPVVVTLDRVLYSRQFDLQAAPGKLTYLVHAPQASEGGTGTVVLSHYISTGGPSGFDHLATASLTRSDGSPLRLRPSWPLQVTFDKYPDAYVHRLKATEGPEGDLPRHTYHGMLHTYDRATGLPEAVEVQVQLRLDYYHGTSDGFAGFATLCPQDVGAPTSPTLCLDW